MLHPINLPASHLALANTVELQRRLMAWLCASSTTGADVVDYNTAIVNLTARENAVKDWLKWYCRQQDILPAIQHIAGLTFSKAVKPIAGKSAVLEWFEDSFRFPEHFDPKNCAPTPWPDELPFSDETNAHLKAFLSGFYKKAFSKSRGLPFNSAGNAVGTGLTNRDYKDDFKKNNFGCVCPACDGDYDVSGEEKDHWIAMDYFPSLSVMPLNLVLLCHRCNSSEFKHNKRTFSTSPAKPFDAWFHPWLRPAATGISVKCVNLQPKVKAICNADNIKVENLNKLLGIEKRWELLAKRQKGEFIRHLVARIEAGDDDTIPLVERELKLAISHAQSSLRKEPHSLVRKAVFDEALASPAMVRAWLLEAQQTLAQRAIP